MATVHLLIKGKVQGVFYRATAKEIADKLGINGWVKNTLDGEVDATVNGPEEAVQEFIAWCRQGPPRARVTDVVVTPKPDDAFSSFIIIK